MDAIDKLNEAIKKVIEAGNNINDETNKMIWDKAPLIIHQRFCHELVSISKKDEGKKLCDVQDFTDMLTAINILENLYPELSKK